jgi:uncharacterized 2Fe-2S/4Fe-4S cluster protein (DUF4445 family)
LAPYVPAETASLDMPAISLGLKGCEAASLHLLPNIAGFVGADHVAMLMGADLFGSQGVVLGMDIGTNTEISLVANGKHYACSTASGPAFEGAHIKLGMRASPGAIEKVLIRDGKIKLQTIGNQKSVGLCGSGILDLVAQLRKEGLITSRGAFTTSTSDPRIRRGHGGGEYVLLTSEENEGTEIAFSRKDINEIQLAKGAMKSGIDILLSKAGITEKEIDRVVIAGAFGTYLDVESGIQIGMFPALQRSCFTQVGNAAGTGARMALLSKKERTRAMDVARGVNYIELTAERDFSSIFARSLLLD